MRRIYFIVPLFGLLTIAGYYAHWEATTAPAEVCKCRGGIPGWPCEHRDGARDAQAALKRGEHILLTYGLPSTNFTDYEFVLLSDYGTSCRMIAGCVVDDNLLRYANAYNAVMQQDLEQKFGRDVFQVTRQKAAALYAARTAAEVQP